MNKKNLLPLLVLVSTLANAQDLKVFRLNTPSINIDGKECKVGDSFTKASKITWSDAKQVVIAKDSSGKLLRMSSAAAEGKNGYSVEKLLGLQRTYKHLSSRGAEDESEVSGEYILDETVKIPTGMNKEDEFKIELLYKDGTEQHSYSPVITDDKSFIVVDRKLFFGNNPHTLKVQMICHPAEWEPYCISDEILIVPIEDAL